MKRFILASALSLLSLSALANNQQFDVIKRMVDQAIAARQSLPIDCYDPMNGYKSGLVIGITVPASLVPEWASWNHQQRTWFVGEVCDAVWDEADRR